ncbi:hypothetical protein ACBY01_10950 [Sphingomonas sp. ac-8]|uniref:hypothetical protein n=1 Tax=Sphingomonas sp. ac-8 TaxID=3242977 RepID=UPI003A7F8E73
MSNAEPPDSFPSVEHPTARRSAVTWIVIVAIAAALAIAFVRSTTNARSGSGSSTAETAGSATASDVAAHTDPPTRDPFRYELTSSVPGSRLVHLDDLPRTTPYRGDADVRDGYCGDTVQAKSVGGRLAEQRGWRIAEEVRFKGLDAVLVVRGYDPGTSGHCFAKDPNIAFFRGDRLIGLLYGRGKNGIGMNTLELVGGHLRVSDDTMPVGQFTLSDTHLSFDAVAGSDPVCGGRFEVPAVFGQRYSQARTILAEAGWTAKPSSVDAGEDARTLAYRTRFPDTDACSGTGYAYCAFSLVGPDGVTKLGITTQGEDADPIVVDYRTACDGTPAA